MAGPKISIKFGNILLSRLIYKDIELNWPELFLVIWDPDQLNAFVYTEITVSV